MLAQAFFVIAVHAAMGLSLVALIRVVRLIGGPGMGPGYPVVGAFRAPNSRRARRRQEVLMAEGAGAL